jgi:hypothetical protein
MTLQLLHSDFPHIWGKIDFLFISVHCTVLYLLLGLYRATERKMKKKDKKIYILDFLLNCLLRSVPNINILCRREFYECTYFTYMSSRGVYCFCNSNNFAGWTHFFSWICFLKLTSLTNTVEHVKGALSRNLQIKFGSCFSFQYIPYCFSPMSMTTVNKMSPMCQWLRWGLF